jgi:hypothetical protein
MLGFMIEIMLGDIGNGCGGALRCAQHPKQGTEDTLRIVELFESAEANGPASHMQPSAWKCFPRQEILCLRGSLTRWTNEPLFDQRSMRAYSWRRHDMSHGEISDER